LTAIATNAQACVRLLESDSCSGDKLGDALERIGAQAERAGEIIRQLRQFVRKEQPERSLVDLNESIDEVLVTLFIEAHESPPDQIVLDVDATDDPLYGEQEGRFFHGYYRHYCYLPLYVFCGEHLLCARLRPSNIDASAGTVEELERIVRQIRASWPEVKILVRGDSGFCRDKLMSWCEVNGVDFVLGIAKNERLKASIADELATAEQLHEQTGRATRVFKDFRYRTLKSWSRERRMVGKAEHLAQGPNPRFVVTSLTPEAFDARALYEDLYCARGDMENRIKEQQLGLFADRTSTATLRANQLRLYFSSIAVKRHPDLRIKTTATFTQFFPPDSQLSGVSFPVGRTPAPGLAEAGCGAEGARRATAA